MGIRLDFTLGNTTGFYAFELHALSQAGYEVKREQCSIIASASVHEFNVEAGVVTHASTPTAPAASKERLYLVNASGLKEFRPLYEALSSMGFYNLHAKAMRDLQDPDDGRPLRLRRAGGGRGAGAGWISFFLDRDAHGAQGRAQMLGALISLGGIELTAIFDNGKWKLLLNSSNQ